MLYEKTLNDLLNNVALLIEKYNYEAWNSNQLNTILKELTANLFYLEKYRTDFHKKYNSIMYNHTGSVASGRIAADEKVPELYMLRRLMTASYRIVDALRSNISMIKKEL